MSEKNKKLSLDKFEPAYLRPDAIFNCKNENVWNFKFFSSEFHSFLKKEYDNILNTTSLKGEDLFKENKELSTYKITADGIISDSWDSIVNIEARLIEIAENSVVLECLIDTANKEFQNRIFPKSLIDGFIPLEINQPILIKIFTRKAEIKYQFVNGVGLFDLERFNIDYFNDISFDIFNKKLK